MRNAVADEQGKRIGADPVRGQELEGHVRLGVGFVSLDGNPFEGVPVVERFEVPVVEVVGGP